VSGESDKKQAPGRYCGAAECSMPARSSPTHELPSGGRDCQLALVHPSNVWARPGRVKNRRAIPLSARKVSAGICPWRTLQRALAYNGAPRSMKMRTIASLWHYDAMGGAISAHVAPRG
jgi:hypothetical protein